MGTNDRKRETEDLTPVDPPSRRWGRALIWLAVIVALGAGALVVSYAAEDRRDAMAEPPFDTDVFCLTAARFGEFRELDLDGGGGAEQVRALQTVARQLGTLSPEPIAEDLNAVGEALQNVVGVVEAVPADEPDAIAIVTQTFDEQLGSVSEQADEAAAYIERWCGPPASSDGATTSLPG